MNYKLVLSIFTIIIEYVTPAKILAVCPTQMRSHYIVVEQLLRDLAESGHKITVVSQFPIKDPPANYREVVIDVPNKSYEDYTKAVARNPSDFDTFVKFINWATDVTNSTLVHPKMRQLMTSNETFDLYLYEIFINDALIGLAHHFNASVIGFSTLGTSRWVQEFTGTPLPSSHVAHFLLGFSDRMNFFERFINTFMNIYEHTMFPIYFNPPMQKIYDQNFAEPKPSFHEIRKSAMSLALLNSHISTRGAQPHMTNVIECGGMHLKRQLDDLPEDLKVFLDNSSQGVVYLSLGSNMKPAHLGEQRRNAIIQVLSGLKENIVWNWDHESATTVDSKKFFTSKWLPQNEILAHPKVKLFITHGGLLSLTEAVYYGVPVVGFAIFADQKYNLVKAVEDGYGQLIDFSNVTEESLRWAVTEILGNSKYEIAAERISKRFKDRPMNGLQTAKFWIEYVIRNDGAEFLQSPALELNIMQYFNLDVIAVICLIIYLIVLMVKRLVLFIVRKVFGSNNELNVTVQNGNEKMKTY